MPVAYNADAVGNLTAMGQVPRNALPMDERVDAFIVIWGSVEFWHTPGLTGGMFQLDVHYPILSFQRTTSRNTSSPNSRWTSSTRKRNEQSCAKRYSHIRTLAEKAIADPHWHVRGKGAKERPEGSWLCGSPLTEEKKQELKDDYRTIIQAVFDFALPVLRLAPTQQTQ